MNLVALLIAPAVVTLALVGKDSIRLAISLAATAVIVVAVIISKRRPIAVGEEALVN
jgi:K(+)-stimulated pyrophosphate-energized sodium pump